MLSMCDIKEFSLNPNIKYVVKDDIRCKRYECRLIFQTDFIFLFKIIDLNIYNNKICISKVDYYLNRNIINSVA